MIKRTGRADRTVLAGLVALAVIVFGAAVRLRLPGLPMGDEPHYLALTQAMLKYHTFDPTPVYEHRDYWSYYPAEIDAHVAVVDGRPVPFHNLGAPMLFALPFLLWGRAGAHLLMLAVAVLTVVNVYRLQREHGIRTAYAGFVTVLFVLGSPVYVYASMLFVEPLGMLALIYAARVLLTDRPPTWRLLLASAGVGALPWIHGRYAIFPVTFALLAVLCLRGSAGRFHIAALAPVVVLATGLEVFNVVMYRSLSPAPGSTDALGEGLLRQSPLRGLLYLAFDGRFGMVPNFPVLVLAGAGILLCVWRVRRLPGSGLSGVGRGLVLSGVGRGSRLSGVDRGSVHRRINLVLLGTIAPYTILIATYPNWPGGFSPPGRLLSVTTPLLAYYVAVLLQRLPAWPVLVFAEVATAYGYAMSLLSDAYPLERFHWLASPGNTPLARMTDLLGTSVDLLPPLVTADNGIDAAGGLRFTLWAVVTAAVTVLLWQAARRSPAGVDVAGAGGKPERARGEPAGAGSGLAGAGGGLAGAGGGLAGAGGGLAGAGGLADDVDRGVEQEDGGVGAAVAAAHDRR